MPFKVLEVLYVGCFMVLITACYTMVAHSCTEIRLVSLSANLCLQPGKALGTNESLIDFLLILRVCFRKTEWVIHFRLGGKGVFMWSARNFIWVLKSGCNQNNCEGVLQKPFRACFTACIQFPPPSHPSCSWWTWYWPKCVLCSGWLYITFSVFDNS